MSRFPEPSPANDYLVEHCSHLQRSFQHWTGRDLVDSALSPAEQAKTLFNAPFALVSADTAADPVYNYGNRTALALFEMTWAELTVMPGRQSAEPVNQEERDRLLAEVAAKGFVEHYDGIRISKNGRRFIIQDVTVWNLLDAAGKHYGQAAMFARWTFLS